MRQHTRIIVRSIFRIKLDERALARAEIEGLNSVLENSKV